MKKQNESFAKLLRSFDYHFDSRTVFDDFLTMTLCAFSPNPRTGQSHDEALYIETIAKYSKSDLRHQFPNMLAKLVVEMEERLESDSGNDVLGEYYEENLRQKGSSQFFTPWHICEFMATITMGESEKMEDGNPLRVLDPCCGSGRMLVAGAKVNSPDHEYYGIDIDLTCVKMTALNLFLNGVFGGEVMNADALAPDDFRQSYHLSFMPFGIFRIEQKEKSRLWHLHKNSFNASPPLSSVLLPSEMKDGKVDWSGSQLKIF